MWRPIAPQFNYMNAATTTKKSPARSRTRSTKSGKPAKKSPHRYHDAFSPSPFGTTSSKSPQRSRTRSKSPVRHSAFDTPSYTGHAFGPHMAYGKSPKRHTNHNVFGKSPSRGSKYLKSPKREMIKMYSNLTPAEKVALKKRVLELANKM
jgi:hypothetical protein